jgi:hypothetical protein
VIFSDKVPAKYIAEFRLPPRVSVSFAQLNRVAPVLLVLQDGKTLANPPDDFLIKGGGTVFVLANADDIEKVRHRLRGATELQSSRGDSGGTPGPV